jgi:hypothetical protein
MSTQKTVSAIIVYPQKKGAGAAVERAFLREGLGLEGDAFASGGERQVSLMTREILDALADSDADCVNECTPPVSAAPVCVNALPAPSPAESRPAHAAAGVCVARYKYNLLLDGVSADDLKPGARFAAGNAVLQISDSAKKCFAAVPDGLPCDRANRSVRCPLAGARLFAAVVQSGFVHTGCAFDPV